MIFKSLRPADRCRTIYDINLEALRGCGIRGLIFDIDNTLEPYATARPSARLTQWLQEAARSGFELAILSNAKSVRTTAFCAGFPEGNPPITWIAKAGKPLRKGFRAVASELHLKPEQLVMIGDQLFTDIWGGNRFGCRTILVDPILPEAEPPFVHFKRFLERPFL